MSVSYVSKELINIYLPSYSLHFNIKNFDLNKTSQWS